MIKSIFDYRSNDTFENTLTPESIKQVQLLKHTLELHSLHMKVSRSSANLDRDCSTPVLAALIGHYLVLYPVSDS